MAAERKADRNVKDLESLCLLVMKRTVGVTASKVMGVQIAMKTQNCNGSPMASLFEAVAVAENQSVDADGDRSCSGCKQSADDVMSQAAGLIHVA